MSRTSATAAVTTPVKSPRRAKAAAPAAKATATAPISPAAKAARDVRRAAELLKQAGDPTRARILAMLGAGERYVGAICAEMGLSQPAVSHHLALLRAAQIIEPRRQGKNNFYNLTAKGRVIAGAIESVMAEDEDL